MEAKVLLYFWRLFSLDLEVCLYICTVPAERMILFFLSASTRLHLRGFHCVCNFLTERDDMFILFALLTNGRVYLRSLYDS